MTKVIADISMSLDGFVTAPNVRPEEPLGDGADGSTSGRSATTSATANSSPRQQTS